MYTKLNFLLITKLMTAGVSSVAHYYVVSGLQLMEHPMKSVSEEIDMAQQLK